MSASSSPVLLPARSTYTRSCLFSGVSGGGLVNTYDSRDCSIREESAKEA